MFARIASLFPSRWSSRSTGGAESGIMSYDVVINYVDEDRDPTTKTFSTPESREAGVSKILAAAAGTGEDDEKAIASVVLEDCLIFWKRSKATPSIPDRAPVLKGQGEKVLRVRTTGKGTIETAGYSMRSTLELLNVKGMTKGLEPVEASVILRRTAYDRRSALVASA